LAFTSSFVSKRLRKRRSIFGLLALQHWPPAQNQACDEHDYAYNSGREVKKIVVTYDWMNSYCRGEPDHSSQT
jgi:hypothetical protein